MEIKKFERWWWLWVGGPFLIIPSQSRDTDKADNERDGIIILGLPSGPKPVQTHTAGGRDHLHQPKQCLPILDLNIYFTCAGTCMFQCLFQEGETSSFAKSETTALNPAPYPSYKYFSILQYTQPGTCRNCYNKTFSILKCTGEQQREIFGLEQHEPHQG